MLATFACNAHAQTLRIATFNTELHGSGPGEMLHAILQNSLAPVQIAQTIAAAQADILVLQGIDYDTQSHGLNALRKLISTHGQEYPFTYAPRPNTGWLLSETDDALQGYGAFKGQRGLAILSQHPIDHAQIQNFTDMTWQNAMPHFPQSIAPVSPIAETQRLSSVAHVAVPIIIGNKRITILSHHATPPNFDGPEDRNGRRNAAENLFWLPYLSGTFGKPSGQRYVLASVTNIDPTHGDGRRQVMQGLLSSNRFQDPLNNRSAGETFTANWPAPGPGKLRVSYLLPSPDLRILGTGQLSLTPDSADQPERISRHRLIWLDIAL